MSMDQIFKGGGRKLTKFKEAPHDLRDVIIEGTLKDQMVFHKSSNHAATKSAHTQEKLL